MVAKEEAIEAARRDAEQARERLAGAIEALPATFELYDPADRLVLWNHALAETYPHIAPHLDKRLTFAQLAVLNLEGGGQPDQADRAEEWLALRLAQRRRGEQPSQLMNNGRGRWLRMAETRLRDGSIVAIRVDVTDFEDQRRALEQAQQELARSRQRLEDAIEALPAGFELYDADDRLMMVNRMNLEMYPLLADLADQRPTFEQVVRTNAARGGLPFLNTPEKLDAWIERRLNERRNPSEVAVHQTAEGRWIRIYERRMRDGGMVAIRLDVSELMQREQELNLLNDRLAQLNQELSVLSQTDALTGLANRRAFDHRLAEELSRAARHAGATGVAGGRYRPLQGLQRPLWPSGWRRLLASGGSRAARMRRSADRPGGPPGWRRVRSVAAASRQRRCHPVAERCLRAVEAAAIAHAGSPVAPHVTVSVGVAESINPPRRRRTVGRSRRRAVRQSGRVGVASCWLTPNDPAPRGGARIAPAETACVSSRSSGHAAWRCPRSSPGPRLPGRARAQAKWQVGRADPEQAGGQGHQANPAPQADVAQEAGRNQDQTQTDAEHAVEAADVLLHDTLLQERFILAGSSCQRWPLGQTTDAKPFC